ncbi:TonB-dependent receptor [Phocaeicola sp.]
MKKQLSNKEKRSQNCRPLFCALFLAMLAGGPVMPVHAEGWQETKITVVQKNVTFGQAISEIESASGYSIVVRDNDINLNEKVTVQVQNKSLREALDQLVKGQKLTYKMTGKNISIYRAAPESVKQNAKSRKVSGVVKDATGEPVIGATVVEKGTSNGIVTDLDGNFSLNVGPDAVLMISYIGYADQEIPTGNKTTFNVVLKEDTKVLDEVVVVGFGSQKKVNLTGSVSTISSEVFAERPVQSATMALQGVIPGLNISKGTGRIDETASINVRGMTTIGEGSSGNPLILIDGMEGDLNTLNPQDIENVSVLKDAAASSIYGSRAPFGVILVTTKNGKSDKFVVNYNNSFRWSTPTKRPKTVDSYRFATYFNDAAANAKMTGHFSPERMQRIRDYIDGKINTVNIPNPSNPSVWADGYDYANANIDWYDELYDKWAFAQEHTASVNGGTEKVQMYASFNYLGQEGMLKVNKDTYDRYATNLKVTSQLTDYLDIKYNMKYLRTESERPYNIGNLGAWGYQTWPVLPVYDDNGYLYSSPSPILSMREGGKAQSNNDSFIQQLQVNFRPLKGLEIVGEVNYALSRNRYHEDVQKVYNHNVAGEVIPNGDNTWVYEDSYTDDYMNFNVYSTYNLELNGGHNLKAMVGFQNENKNSGKISASRNGITVPGMDVIDITNGTDGSGKSTPPSVGGWREDWGVIGFFGRVNYDYQGRYLLEANIRHDGSSRFRRDNRWKTFPSVSVGWNVARENFFEPVSDLVSTLKLRASYGELGNQNTKSLYPTYITMPVGTADSGWIINGKKDNTASAPGLISSTLTWETVKSFNVGVDVDMLSNKLNLSFDWYQRDTKDMVGPAPELPVILGTGVPKTNNTDLRTRGWEFSAKWRDRINNDWSYDVAFNLSDATTKITNYPNENFNLDTYFTGQNVGDIWGYETIGIAKSQEEMDRHLASLPNGGQNSLGSQWEAGDIMYKDLNGDGTINNGANTLNDHGDLKVIGNNTPRFRFGLNLGMSWKGLDVSAFFQGVMKRDYWEGSYNFWGWNGWIWRSTAYEEHMDYFRADADHFMGQNLNAYYPRPVQDSSKNLQTQTKYLQNAAYIRLQNLQIGYSLPKNVMEKIKLTNLRFYVSGENLWFASGVKKMFDPEALGYGSGSIGYPIQKTISAGVSVTL